MKQGLLGFIILVLSIWIIISIVIFFTGVPDPGMDNRLKLFNISNKEISLIMIKDSLIYNRDIYDFAQSLKNRRDYFDKPDIFPYSKGRLEIYDNWKKQLKINRIFYYYLLDFDSLKDLYYKPILDSNLIKKIILKRLDITLDYIKKSNWTIVYKPDIKNTAANTVQAPLPEV